MNPAFDVVIDDDGALSVGKAWNVVEVRRHEVRHGTRRTNTASLAVIRFAMRTTQVAGVGIAGAVGYHGF